MPTIRVLLVDDYEIVRNGLRRMLELDRRIDVVGVASSGEEAIDMAARLSPQVVTMDLKMSGMGGIAATREIKRLLPDAQVLVLTMYSQDVIGEAIDAGASGFLLKDVECEDIIEAIHQVCAGRHPLALSTATLECDDVAWPETAVSGSKTGTAGDTLGGSMSVHPASPLP